MVRFLLATLLVPLAFATHIPMPTHPAKGMSPALYKMVLKNLKTQKQYDLSKYGFKVEKSLTYAGSVNEGQGMVVLVGVSPKGVEPMLHWYRAHMKGWRVVEHIKGSLVRLAPGHATAKAIHGHHVAVMSIAKCLGHSYQAFPCASVVRFYSPLH